MRVAIIWTALALASTAAWAQETAWTHSSGRISLDFASAGWAELGDRPASAPDTVILAIAPAGDDATNSMSRSCLIDRTFIELPNATQRRANDIMRKAPPTVQVVERNGIAFHRFDEKLTNPYEKIPARRLQDIYFVATEGGFENVVFICLIYGAASGDDSIATELRSFMDTLQLHPTQ